MKGTLILAGGLLALIAIHVAQNSHSRPPEARWEPQAGNVGRWACPAPYSVYADEHEAMEGNATYVHCVRP